MKFLCSLKRFSLLCFLMFTSHIILAADFTWTGLVDGNWNTAGNWDLNAVPSSSDDCYFTTNASVSSGGDCNNLTVAVGATLTVSSSVVSVSGSLINNGSLIVQGTIDVLGNCTLNGPTTINTLGEIQVRGNSIVSNGVTLNNQGVFDANGSFDATGATVALAGASFLGSENVLNGNNGTTTGWTVTNGGDGWRYNGQNYTGSPSGSFTGSYYWSYLSQDIDLTTLYSTADLDASPDIVFSCWIKSVFNDNDYFYAEISLKDASGSIISTSTLGSTTVSTSAPIWTQQTTTFSGYGSGVRTASISIQSEDGEFWLGNYGMTVDDISLKVTEIGSGGVLQLADNVVSLGDLDGGTVDYDGAGAQTILSDTYYNLQLSGDGTGNKTAGGNITVDNNFTVGANAQRYRTSSFTTTVNGETLIKSMLKINNSNGEFIANGEFNASSATIDFTKNGSLVLSSTVTSLGTLDISDNTGTVVYDGTINQTVDDVNYYNLTINNSSTKTAAGNIVVKGDLITEAEANCVLDLVNYNLNLSGDLTVGSEGGLDASDSDCSVTFSGTSSITHAGSQSRVTLPAQTLLSESFVDFSNWVQFNVSGSASWFASAPGGNCTFTANSGTSCAWIQENSYTFSQDYIVYDLPDPKTNMSVSYKFINPDWAGDIDWLYCQYYDGSTWISLAEYTTANEIWTSATHSIPDGATQLRFFTWLGYGYGVGVDDVVITGDGYVYTSINPTFNELVVNGSGITMNNPIDVTENLVFTNGIITSESDVNGNNSQAYASTNTLTIKDGATISGASASSHVIGAVRIESSAISEIEFPTGDGTNYRPVFLSPADPTPTTYTAEYVNSAHSSISYDGNGYNNTPCEAGEVDHVAMGCWWDIEKSAGGADAFVGINWDANSGVDTPSDIVLTHWNSTTSQWDKISGAGDVTTQSNGGGGAGSGTASSGRITSATAQSDFSPFNLGSGSGNNSLPVDLLSFHTVCSHDIVDVNFSVVSQINNDYFLIERSTDAMDWEVVGQIDGVEGGNSNTQMDYVFVDNNPLANLSYYRLTQVDFDGKSKTFYPVSTTCGGSEGGLPIDVYPNPASNEVTVELELDNYQGDDVYYTITDATGKAVLSDYVQLDRGFNKHTLDIGKLPNGVYILRFNQTKDHITETRIVKR